MATDEHRLIYVEQLAIFTAEAIITLTEQAARNGALTEEALGQIRAHSMNIGNPYVPPERQDWARHQITRLSQLVSAQHGDRQAPRAP